MPFRKINLSSFQYEMGFNVSTVFLFLLLCVLQFVFPVFLFFCHVLSFFLILFFSLHLDCLPNPDQIPPSFLPLFIYACLYHLLLSQFVFLCHMCFFPVCCLLFGLFWTPGKQVELAIVIFFFLFFFFGRWRGLFYNCLSHQN